MIVQYKQQVYIAGVNVFRASLRTLYTANASLVVSTETIVSCHISQIITRTLHEEHLSSVAHQVLQNRSFIREAKGLVPSCHNSFKQSVKQNLKQT